MKSRNLTKRCLICILILIAVSSCSTQKKTPEVSVLPPEPAKEEVIIEEKKAAPAEEVKRSEGVKCMEDTSLFFNFSGMSVLPFIKAAFSDMNGDGLIDMIAGNKAGSLLLYGNSGDAGLSHWEPVHGYFDGIKAGAFSVPSVGDLDGDGVDEIIVGTGGFSSESGKILFFRNDGKSDQPQWRKIEGQDLKIGDDAAVTVVDYNFDNMPDIIAGNSEGSMFFFKNTSAAGGIRFVRDKSLSIKRLGDKYIVPAAVKSKDQVILIVGTSMGQLYQYVISPKKKGLISSVKVKIEPLSARFISPAFASLVDRDRTDLVLSDGDGNLSYYVNKQSDFTLWEKDPGIFNDRLSAGPACAPTVSFLENRMCMIVGSIDGNLKFYEFNPEYSGLPWAEKSQYLKGIKLSGFSRGVMAMWNGREILITGESSGKIRAFINSGSAEKPLWREEKKFFGGVSANGHSTPAVFDLDNDGKWELFTGDADGRISAFRIKDVKNGLPLWEKIAGVFDHIRARGFSSPSFVKYRNILYLFVGQEDGDIRTFTSEFNDNSTDISSIVFTEKDMLSEMTMQDHSSPFAIMNSEAIELISGDYDGNLRHFRCGGS